jgi:hypothetical protein
MWDRDQQDRLAFDEALVKRYHPGFGFYNRTGATYIAGGAHTNDGRTFRGRIDLPPGYPYEQPRLYITEPSPLWTRDGRKTIASLGVSHSFHSLGEGPFGSLEICHSDLWDSSMTCVILLNKLHLWCEAYAIYLRRGRPIAEVLGVRSAWRTGD